MTLDNITPRPVSFVAANGTFALSALTRIYVEPATDEVKAIGQFLADHLNPSTGLGLQVQASNGAPDSGGITLTLTGANASLGDEGYELTITPEGIKVVASKPAGLFHGMQTIRQLLPPAIESASVQPRPWLIPAGTVKDTPRFAWRGVMLDVARHFFGVEDLKRSIDLLAAYKINRLHLHLSDDQGWRIEIKSWPKLTEVGGNTQVGGGAGGFYTQAEYAELAAYAGSRYITIVPEIDMPGHVNAALASYPELNCNNQAPELYSGTNVGFSSLCVNKEVTYTFVKDVLGELAALTPGPYLHVGGDEAHSTSKEDYLRFVERLQAIVAATGKQMVGWEEIVQAKPGPDAIAQHWNLGDSFAPQAVQQGLKVLMSPADKAYIDMKYDPSTPLGLDWAGTITVKTGYDWDPAAMVSGVGEKDILGVEAPLWSETIQTAADIDFMTFPRLIGYAEIGWSPQSARRWEDYRLRLAVQGPRLEVLGVNYYRSPEIPWP